MARFLLVLAFVLAVSACDTTTTEGRTFRGYILSPEPARFGGSAVIDASAPCLTITLGGGFRGVQIFQDCTAGPVDVAPGFYPAGPGTRFQATFEEVTGGRPLVYEAVSGTVRIESRTADRVVGRFLLETRDVRRPADPPILVRGWFDAATF